MGLHPLSWSLRFKLRAGVLPSQHYVTEGGGAGLWAALPHLWYPSDAAKALGTARSSPALPWSVATQSRAAPMSCCAPGGLYRDCPWSWQEDFTPWSCCLVTACPALGPYPWFCLGGKLRPVQWWHQPWPPPLPVTSVPKHHAAPCACGTKV